jgi:DNA primase
LKKGEPRVILAYDGDKAGKAAALKASKMLAQSSFEGGVVLFEEGKDPADLVKESKLDYLKNLFGHPKKFIEFVIETTAAAFDINQPEQKQAAFNEIDGFLKTLSPIMQEHYRSLAASQLKSSEALFKVKKSFAPAGISKSYDAAEMSILKTLLTSPAMIDFILDISDASIFEHHRDLFQKIVEGKMGERGIVEIDLNDRIVVLNDEELKEKIVKMQVKKLQKELNVIKNDQALDFRKKSFEIRKTQDRIKRLRAQRP